MREWQREQQRLWEEERRFEELDTDEDDGQGVGLNFGAPRRRFPDDDQHFEEFDISSRSRQPEQRDIAYGDHPVSSDEGGLDNGHGAMQVALRDKEEWLVQRAMERIRRAQMLGKRDVNLTQPELEALQRKRTRATSEGRIKGTDSGAPPGSQRRPRRGGGLSAIFSSQPDTAQTRPRKSKARLSNESIASISTNSSQPYASGGAGPSPPGLKYRDPNSGATTYAPVGLYGPPSSPRATPKSRYSSLPEPPPSLPRPNSRSGGPLPHEPNWMPRSRSSSNAVPYQISQQQQQLPQQQSYSTVDPFQYQVSSSSTSLSSSSPAPQQHPPSLRPGHTSGRRNVSGPPEVSYSSVRRKPPGSSVYGGQNRMGLSASSSDPAVATRGSERRRMVIRVESETEDEGEEEEIEIEEEEDDDEDEDVDVDEDDFDEDEEMGVEVGVIPGEWGGGAGGMRWRG
ncbi:MAG: hypothetical protein M1837_006763 [Sclerophora amabilis]|nr:MAG: hypothetical protein M1837_006763 [Sclerophora amabilis]